MAASSNAWDGDSPAACASRTSVGAGGPPADSAVASAPPGTSRAITFPRSSTRQRSIRPSTLGSCSAHRIADPARASSSRSSATDTVPAGSSCAVGSSRTSTVVPIATMLAMATRCCSPPDRANGSRSARWPIASRASVASIRASISSRGTPRFSSPKASSSRTVSFDADSWLAGVAKTIPTRPRSAPAGAATASCPSTTTRPPTFALTTRGMNPAAASARVDLPAPVRPATPTRSPAATVTATPSMLGFAPAGIADRQVIDQQGQTVVADGRFGRHRPSTPNATSTIATAATRIGTRSQRSTGGSATIR